MSDVEEGSQYEDEEEVEEEEEEEEAVSEYVSSCAVFHLPPGF